MKKEVSKQAVQNRIKYLRENTDFVATVLDGLNGYAIIAADLDGNVTAYNDVACRSYGYTPEEIIGKQNIEIFFPKEFIGEGNLHRLIKDLRKKGKLSCEGENVRKDGEIFPVRTLLTLVRDKNGKAFGFIEIVEDITEHRRVEEERKTAASRIAVDTIEGMPDAITLYDLDGTIRQVNSEFERGLGWKREEILGRMPSEVGFTSKEEGQRIEKEVIPKLMKEGFVRDFETIVARRDGTQFPVLESWSLMKDDEGKPTNIIAATKDVSARKEAEEALRKSEERYRLLLDASKAGINLIDKDGTFLIVNNEAAAVWGKKPEDVIGKHYTELGGSPEFNNQCKRLLELVAKGKTTTQERYVDTLDKYFIEDARPVKDSAGNFIGAQIMTYDITEHKKADKALGESEERLRFLLENIPDFVMSVDRNYKILMINRGVPGFITVEQAIGTEAFNYVEPAYHKIMRESLDKVFQTGMPEKYEVLGMGPEGPSTAWYETRVSPNKVDGQVISVTMICSDITVRKQAEERVEHLNLVLRAISNVNQLIVKEKNPKKLLKGICEDLTETRGYSNAWIALLDESGKLAAYAESGLGKDFLPVVERLKRGELVTCGQQAIEQPEVVVTVDPVSTCTDCPLSGISAGRSGATVRLEYDGKVYGLLAVSVPVEMATDVEELDLLHEVATDIAFALHNIELEEARKQADKELVAEKRKFENYVESMADGLCVNDASGTITQANEALIEMFGYKSPEGLLGKTIFDNVAQREIPRVTEVFTETVENKESGIKNFEVICSRRDGSEFLASFGIRNLWVGKEYVGSISTARDITECRQVEETLRESEERYRTLYESSLDGIVTLNLESAIMGCNKAYADMLGYSQEELTKVECYDLTPSKWHAHIEKTFQKVVECGYSDVFEKECIRKDGTVFPVAMHAWRMDDKDGSPAGIGVIVRDITEQKQAEEALRESEERLSCFMESATDCFVIFDSEMKYVQINKAAEKMLSWLGLTKEDVIGKNILEVIPVLKETGKYEKFLEVLKTGKPFVADDLIPHPKFGDKHLNMKAFKMGKGLGMIATDITARKQAEALIKEEKEQAERYLDIAGVMLATVNADESIAMINKKGCEILGYKEEELIGRNWFDTLVPKGIRDEVRGISAKLMAGDIKTVEYHENPLLTKDGRERLIAFHNTLMKDPDGQITGTLLSGEDITERKQSELKRRELEQKAQAANRLSTVGEMASGIAHEINNPLTSIIGFAWLLLEKDTPDDIKEYAKYINDGSERVASIVGRLLTFARQQKPEKAPADINHIMETTLQLQAYEMRTSNIKTTTQFDLDLPQITVDAGQLQQVFLNMILNAATEMSSTNKGGKLLIKTERIDNTIRISFEDDGPGIAEENLERVFEPFFTTRKPGKGTGLGLSVCHGIITEHDGQIYAKNNPDKGVTFTIELPIATRQEQPVPVEAANGEPLAADAAKILVVDDEPATLHLLSQVLGAEGYAVQTVDNASDALEMIKDDSYNLVLLDIKMPGMSGIELYRKIQETAPSLAENVVFITGDTINVDTRDFLIKTKVSCIIKPFNIVQLKRDINRRLTRCA